MKKFILAAIMVMATLGTNAQGNWQTPVESPQDEVQTAKGGKKKKDNTIDPKYLEGAVPEVDGKVVWSRDIKADGKTATEIYDFLISYFQKFVKEDNQTELSKVTAVNPTDKQLYVRIQEWLVFTNKFLALDQTKFRYTILADCKDGKCTVTIAGLSYLYEEDRPTSLFVTAEEWISDKNALNKKKTGFFKGGTKKFRMKTIDRIDEIYSQLEQALNAK